MDYCNLVMYFSSLNLSCISFAFYAVCRKSGVGASGRDFRWNMFIQAYTIILNVFSHPFTPDSIFGWKNYHSGKEVSTVAKETSQNRMKWNEQRLGWTRVPSKHPEQLTWVSNKVHYIQRNGCAGHVFFRAAKCWEVCCYSLNQAMDQAFLF